MSDEQTHLFLNPVKADRAEEFEAFLREVAQPVTLALRPELAGKWRLLKPAAPEAGDASVVTYGLLFEGGSLEDDWDLYKLLAEHHGAEEAERLMARWVDTFAGGVTWVNALQQTDDEPTQIGWSFRTVPLDG